MAKQIDSRFAAFDSRGRVTALVADGPAWPDDGDLTALDDDALGALHELLMEEGRAMAADPDNLDPAAAAELGERIAALRVAAAQRFADAEGGAGDPAPPADPPAPTVEAPSGDDADRAAALAGLQATLEPVPALDDAAPALDSIDPAAVAAATTAGVAAALAPLMESVTALTTAVAERPRVPAQPRRGATAADLARYRDDDRAPIDAADLPRQLPRGRLVHTGDVPGVQMGAEIETLEQLTQMFVRRHDDIGQSVADDEKVVVASYKQPDPPAERDLRGMDSTEVRRRIREVCGPDALGVDPWNLGRELPIGKGGMIVSDSKALVASGGLAAPVEPYYPQLVIAEADRPVYGALPGFVAERGGIRLVLPPSLGTLSAATTPGLFADGVTNTDTSLVSATAAFTAADVGKSVVNAGSSTFIPAGTIINSVTNGTTVVLSAATTGTGTGQSFYIPSRNPNNLGVPVGKVTAAQDAAGPPNVIKYTYDVPIGSQAEHDVYSIYTSLQFANLTARTFPEQVEANILLANALAARVADTAALDYITGWSTLFTFAKTFGTARQLLAQFDHMAAYYRNHNRMDPRAVLRLGIPAWVINAMRGDVVATFLGGTEAWGLSDDELLVWFRDRAILPFLYWDGPTDVGQLFASPGSGAINTGGVNNATPIACPDYPGTGSTSSFRTKVVSYMWAEGTWLGLTTGELNIGLVRDSILNSQNRFRNFEEAWETPAYVGVESLRCVHTVASDGSYGSAVSVTLGAGSGL